MVESQSDSVMYNIVNGTLVMSVNDWCEAGLSYEQFKNDSKRGHLTIFRRGTKGNTLIDVRSISRIDRRNAIEDAYGKIEADTAKTGLKAVLPDQAAAAFYVEYRDESGKALTGERRALYTNGARLMNTLVRIRQVQVAARARGGERKKLKDWWKECVEFVKENNSSFLTVSPSPYTSILRLRTRRPSFSSGISSYVNTMVIFSVLETVFSIGC